LTDRVTVRPGRHGPRVTERRTFQGHFLPDLGARWWGRFVDGILFLPVTLFVLIALHNAGNLRYVTVVVLFAYEVFCLSRWGQTLGKRVAGTRVISTRAGGAKPTPWQAFLRTAVFVAPDLLILVPRPTGSLLVEVGTGVIVLSILVSRNRRGLHDLVAGTVVVVDGEAGRVLRRP
jgi:uncharacterized RDD family membrane protein YckC